MSTNQEAFLGEMFGLQGKVALVTGGATGIGRMVATGFAKAGARVLIASRKGADCEHVATEINALGASGTAEGFAGDVSTEEGVAALAAAVGERVEKLDILINNAGTSWGAPFEEFPHKAWARVMDVNVTGLFELTKLLAPRLEAAGSMGNPARVINLGSIMGDAPLADGAYSYSASKAAVHHLTKILANEFASRQITVNAFAPGPFQSKMTAFATTSDEQVDKVSSGVPLGRIGAPEDVAGAAIYLCSKAGSYITGAILPIDGGMSVQHGNSLFKGAH